MDIDGFQFEMIISTLDFVGHMSKFTAGISKVSLGNLTESHIVWESALLECFCGIRGCPLMGVTNNCTIYFMDNP